MFESFFVSADGGKAFIEISIMLVGAFMLGFVLSNTISVYSRKKYVRKNQLDKIKSSYTKSKKYGLIEEDVTEKIVDNSLFNQKKNIDIKKDVDNNIDSSFMDNFLEKISINQNENHNQKDFPKKIEGEKNSYLNDLKKGEITENFKIIEDAGEKGFTIKSNFIKDDSILQIHKKNTKSDLTQIEGIGPKIEKLLQQHGIYTFDELAQTDAFKISDILTQAGTRFQMHNPKTWPKQAYLAQNGEWEELRKYQKILKGGKE